MNFFEIFRPRFSEYFFRIRKLRYLHMKSQKSKIIFYEFKHHVRRRNPKFQQILKTHLREFRILKISIFSEKKLQNHKNQNYFKKNNFLFT